MVQRKVANKLRIQPDRVKTERFAASLKPSSYQDVVKNGGADLKKKIMKKSGSIKRSEFESLRSPKSTRHVKQPGKPPPAGDAPTGPATPEKVPSAVSAAITTPNYMKSTTSSDARKEKTQVSTKSPQTSPNGLYSRRKSWNLSNINVASGNKGTARMTSLKMASTPTFKPVRASAKKCSPVAFCENLHVKRATCSSTLKDCKFPTYLTLGPGGTESEGTSEMKVCPYTYCSLNGHRHAALPPLKSFLTARRRMLKNQRSVKLGCLSPRRRRPEGGGLNFDEKVGDQLDLSNLVIAPPTQEEQSDFFVEIYSANKEDAADPMALVEGKDETAAENHEKQVEMPPDGETCRDSDPHENLDGNGDCNLTDTASQYDEENQEAEVAEEFFLPASTHEGTEFGFTTDVAVEGMPNAELYELDSEASETNWEIDYQSAFYLDDDLEYPSKTDNQSDAKGGEVEDDFFMKLDDNIKSCFDESLADEASQESHDEDGLSSDIWSSGEDCESIDSHDDSLDWNNVETSVPVATSEEAPEAALVDMNGMSVSTSETGEKVSLGDTDQAKEAHLPGEVIAETATKPETKGNNLKVTRKKTTDDMDELMDELQGFNPRAPNFLPLQPDPEGENVDLRHQELDERKNSEEWMVDYALRQVVTKLGPARKKKVALLVEAFEKVMPTTKLEMNMRQNSAFEHSRQIQACN